MGRLRGSSMAPPVSTGRVANAPTPVAGPLTVDAGVPLVGKPPSGVNKLPAGPGAAAFAMPSVPPPEPPAASTKVLALPDDAGSAISAAEVRATVPELPPEVDCPLAGSERVSPTAMIFPSGSRRSRICASASVSGMAAIAARRAATSSITPLSSQLEMMKLAL